MHDPRPCISNHDVFGRNVLIRGSIIRIISVSRLATTPEAMMAASSKNIVLAFDLYGTLLNTASIAEKLAEFLGEAKGKAIATTWRVLQLEYTWRLNSMSASTQHVYLRPDR